MNQLSQNSDIIINLVVIAGIVIAALLCLLPTIPVILATYRLVGRMNQTSTVRATGVAATAKVVQISETGTWVNMKPYLNIDLEVQTAEGRSFATRIQEAVSPLFLSQLQPGAMVPVRLDLASGTVALAF